MPAKRERHIAEDTSRAKAAKQETSAACPVAKEEKDAEYTAHAYYAHGERVTSHNAKDILMTAHGSRPPPVRGPNALPACLPACLPASLVLPKVLFMHGTLAQAHAVPCDAPCGWVPYTSSP
eukprot:gene7359-6914_t